MVLEKKSGYEICKASIVEFYWRDREVLRLTPIR